ncbi:MAG TPA: DUF3168 domain-containing protein [Micropepsaceae bacterium]|nr:DUF3168 domain-containing protein [Micropepsaceae bacterium]
MSKAGWPLQKAIFAALSADSTLALLIGDPPRIYDDPPGEVELPYVQIGDGTESDWSTATETGAEHQVSIHVWSRAGGRMEARAILSVIYDALQDAALTLDSNRLVNLRFALSQVWRENDGETYHGTARYRAVTEPSP